jgi:hypothetical protein
MENCFVDALELIRFYQMRLGVWTSIIVLVTRVHTCYFMQRVSNLLVHVLLFEVRECEPPTVISWC